MSARALPLAVLACALLGCSTRARRVPPAPPPLRPAPVVTQPAEQLPVVPPLDDIPSGRLPRDFTPTRYAIALDIDPLQRTFTATLEITGELASPRDVIWLHAEGLTIGRVTATRDGVEHRLVPTLPTTQLLALQASAPLAAGTWTLAIAYSGLWDDAHAEGGFRQRFPAQTGYRYVFTQFEPDYARRVLPSLDEPDRKVPWQVTITAPLGNEVISNAPIEHAETHGRTQTVRFAPTPPLPTYLVAFAVGPFEIVDGGRTASGIPVRILMPRGLRGQTAHAAASTATLVDQIEAWLGVPFPYAKLDVVGVPVTTHWWFAMENAGLVTIDIGALDDAAGWDQTMAHEIAHHWFGDLVTLAWWDDLWLNESFAEWVAQQATGSPRARVAYTPGTAKETVNGGRSDFRQMDWSRAQGQALLSRLALYLGMDRFRAALAHYLRGHAHGTVTTRDFVTSLDAVAGEKLGSLVDDFLAGRHLTHTGVVCKRRKRPRYIVTVAPGTESTPVACVTYERDGTRVDTCKRATGKPAGFDLDTRKCPAWSFGEQLDGRNLDERAWPFLTSHEHTVAALPFITPTGTFAWDYVARIATSRDASLLRSVTNTLWQARENVDPTERTRLDTWIATTIGPQARRNGFARHPEVAALVAAAGDATLLAEARTRIDETSAYRHVLARRALAHADASFAAKVFDELVAAAPDERWRYFGLLRRSPFTLDLLRTNLERAKSKPHLAYLLDDICSEPADDIIALAKAITPTAWERYANAKQIGACVVARRQMTDEVRKFLDAQKQR